MDCVDRNDLIKNLNTFAPECYNALINDLIMKQPAVDVAPVKHGEWTTIDGISRCSECGYIPLYDNAIDDLFYSDYCPYCGAKMDGEKNE